VKLTRNARKWQPTKFVRDENRFMLASRNYSKVSIGSRLPADLAAKWHDSAIEEFAKGKLLNLGCGKALLYGAGKERVSEVTLAKDVSMDAARLEALGGGWAVLIDLLSKLLINRKRMVGLIQSQSVKLLSNRLTIRTELPLAYAVV
jgi:hypothetical protein